MSMIERTNEVGQYHYALSYFRAAQVLAHAKIEATHPHAPTRHLYYHSIELFLKAFLMFKGTSATKLKQIGHRIDKLVSACVDLGFTFEDEDIDVMALIAADDTYIRSRYIEVGSFSWPTIKSLDRTCESLHSSVRAELKSAGLSVR